MRKDGVSYVDVWIGLDVGEREIQVCAMTQSRDVITETTLPSGAEQFIKFVANIAPATIKSIVMEAGLGRGIALTLRDQGFPVTVVDGRKAHRFLSIRHHKTDRNDARGLAELALLGFGTIPTVHLKSVECQQLRTQLVLRNQILKQKNALQSAMRSQIIDQQILPTMPRPSELRSSLEECMQISGAQLSTSFRKDMLALLDLWDAMRGYLASVDKRLIKIASDHPVMLEFMKVPGIGHICAISFYTAIEDPNRFARSSDVGPYLGMVPKVKQSGSMVIKSRITKAGNKLTRTHLNMAARTVISRSNVESAMTDWAQGLAARIGHSKARVAVARKLAVILVSMWKSGSEFQPYPQACELPTGGDRLERRPHVESVDSVSEFGVKSVDM